MRNFYIFNIVDEIAILTRNYPYNLFRIFENIYFLNKNDFNLGLDIFEQVAVPIDKENIKKIIFNKYKDHDFYSVYQNKHCYNNLYLAEKTNLYVKSTYIYLKTNALKPFFFKELKCNKNLFVCDFENKDYFWLSKLRV